MLECGHKAKEAAFALAQKTLLPILAIDPSALSTHRIQVLCVATPEEAVLIEVEKTPGLVDLLHLAKPFGAYDAKAVHHALLKTLGAAPHRWASVQTSALLLAGGRRIDLTLPSLMRVHGLPAPPDPSAGLDALANYARSLANLLHLQGEAIKHHAMQHVSRIEALAVAPIVAMEYHGMPFDAVAWQQQSAETALLQKELGKKLAQLLDLGETNLWGEVSTHLNDDEALRHALFAKGFSVPNVRKSTLATLPDPIGPLLRHYRELFKLTTTYGENFLSHVAADGRVHPTFEQIGTSTGRLSCHSPNLQAMVKGASQRACFRVQPHRRLVIGDYATCELRILAGMSGDPIFTKAFLEGADLHALVAGQMFGKRVSRVENPDLRERAKAINFGLCYGMGAAGLARTIEAPLPQAEALLKQYFKTFPKIGGFLESSAKKALERGFASTVTGRRLYFDGVTTSTHRLQFERVAKNMPIQGTSADMTKLALARVHAALSVFQEAFLVNTVHDELVVECHEKDAQDVAVVLEREMKEAGAEVIQSVPMAVDVVISEAWNK